ncbi:type II toxin-antitoxin system Phd/YefM family antitoxin [Rhizobium sp. SAFR-030]|uniref:type II toxin-antitoxin system Phd/YefM family antitoxin n=1 Tax=Rhizobium sp. SAFR-030 TaxID=3387277 RepID=UPI003F7D4F77
MRILVNVDEAAKRFEELIELALRGDDVLICRAGKPVAELTAIAKPKGTMDDVWSLAEEGRVNVPPGTTSNHDEFYDEHGLPR